VAAAYREAAAELGIAPCQCQAVVWCVWRARKGLTSAPALAVAA
jgi:hypothetical protein